MKSILIIIIFGVLVLGLACGKSEKQKEIEDAAERMEEAGKEMAEKLGEGSGNFSEAMKKMGEAISGGEDVETVDFRELKKILPEDLPGMKRDDARGEKTSAFGIKVSKVEGIYSSDDGRMINITITDMGSLKGVTAFAALAWTMADFDRETDRGYERTTTYEGHKAFEEYNYESESGKTQVVVANRFLIEVDGNNVEMNDIKNAREQIELDKLESWRTYGMK